MKKVELDRLRFLVEHEQQNLCSTGRPLILKLLDEAEPEPEPEQPLEEVELGFDLERVRDHARVRKRVATGEVRGMVDAFDRLIVLQHDLEHMGVDARKDGNFPYRHSHYAAAAHMLRRALDGKCETPTGRLDGHGVYVKFKEDGSWVCAFCDRELSPAPGEWPGGDR